MPSQIANHADLQEVLRRCSPATMEAAIRYRELRDPAEIRPVVFGIIERYQPGTAAVPLAKADDETRLIEDLGLDSLTLLEIVMSIEEVLQIKIANEELRAIRTLEQMNRFLATKTSGSESGATHETVAGKNLSREEIMLALPQQPPFLFVDEASIIGGSIKASYTVRGDEYFLSGHFKGNPIFPASIVFEAMGQVACLWLLEDAANRAEQELPSNQVFFASLEGAHFYRKARPGDKLEFEQTLVQMHEPLAVFQGKVSCRGERVAVIERLTLAFGDEASPNKSVAAVSAG